MKLILDPLIQKFTDELNKKGGKPLYQMSPQDARAVLDTVQSGPVLTLSADFEEHSIQSPCGPCKIQIIRPQGNTHTLPVVVYMHGGGWVLGNEKTHDRLVREIANGVQAAVVFVNYTPAPEGQYPTAHEQGYAVAQWVQEHAAELNVDPSLMVIAGDSVGGLMATAIALMAQERGGPQFIYQLLFYPVTDDRFDTPSYQQFAQGPWLTKPAMEWFWDMYVPNKSERSNPYASPLKASLEQLKQLPPTAIFTNEYDVLRDEGEAYAHKLMEAGVPVASFRMLGVIHDCLMLNPITDAPVIRAAIAQANQLLVEAIEEKEYRTK